MQEDPLAGAPFRLWQLISPTLPVGAYAYSQGLEYAVEMGQVNDRDSALAWIGGLLQHSLSAWDLAILKRTYQAFAANQPAEVLRWNRILLSGRESKELLLEDLQMGKALQRLLHDLALPKLTEDNDTDIAYVTAFSFAAWFWRIPEAQAAAGFAWSWCENQVAAAVKLIPLGQTDGQRLLQHLAETIPAALTQAWSLSDDDIGATSYGLAMASAFHEDQYSRLFRS